MLIKIRLLFALMILTMASVGFAMDPENGAKIYSKHCVNCHGAGGQSMDPLTPNFSQGEGLRKPDGILMNSIRSGKKMMPAYQGILKEQEIYDVLSYVRSFF